MSYMIAWLSGFAACGTIELITRGDPWAGLMAVTSAVLLLLARLHAEIEGRASMSHGEKQ
jgi:hypothetical protein